MIKSAGKIIYDTDNLHLVTFAKNLLEYSDDYAHSVAKNSFWYLDTADSSVAAANPNFEARRLLTANRQLKGFVQKGRISNFGRFSIFAGLS